MQGRNTHYPQGVGWVLHLAFMIEHCCYHIFFGFEYACWTAQVLGKDWIREVS